MRREDLTKLTGSILYKALTAFSMLAVIPLLVYGFFVFYENIHLINFIGRNFMVYALLLITLISALIFGPGLIIRLVRPLLNEASRINKLINSLLNFAKHVRPELATSNINDLVRETVSLLKQESRENIPSFNFDYNQIKQVLLNLIINSFDAPVFDSYRHILA